MSMSRIAETVDSYIQQGLSEVKFSVCQALDIRFGTHGEQQSRTISLTNVDAAQHTSNAASIGAQLFSKRDADYSVQGYNDSLLCMTYETTISGKHVILTFVYTKGQFNMAQEEFHEAMGIFNGRYNDNYK